MRALTGNQVLVADKLFATLDTTVRALHPESVPRVLVSDTVGFIKNLPHGLVASFKSTLDEALEASQRKLATALRKKYPGCIVMSARSDADVAALGARIRSYFEKDLVEAELFLPWSAQNQRGEIFASCKVVEELADGEGAILRVRGHADTVRQLQKQFGRQPTRKPAKGKKR